MSSDRLSGLPEEIISNILSLMPTKYGVRTSVLSKSWRYRWMFVNNLDFDDKHPIYGNTTWTEFVDRILKLCKTSQLNLFRLHFSNLAFPHSSISNWIDEAIKLNVNDLDIQVIHCGLPLSVFTCKTLTKLRLSFEFWEFPCKVNLPCLKTLDVAIYSIPRVNAFKLIRGCPILENLALEVEWPDLEDEYQFNIPTLRRLKVTWLNYSNIIKKVVLNVPNLECLFLGGELCSVFEMKDVTSLVEATISFLQIRSCYKWLHLLRRLVGVKSLSVDIPSSSIDIETLYDTSPLPIYQNMQHLELIGYCCSKTILQFLKSCPELKHLCIDKVDEPFLQSEVYSLVPTCMLATLTTIKISVCKGLKHEMEFLEYMLWKAKVLKKVTITWENSSYAEEKTEPLTCEVLVKLFPMASQDCEIRFHGNCPRFTAVR